MAEFADDFNRANADLAAAPTNGWLVEDEDGTTFTRISIVDHLAVVNVTGKRVVAAQSGTLPATFDVQVGAVIISTREGAGEEQYIDVGLGWADGGVTGLDDDTRSVFVRFFWLADGVRRIQLRTKAQGAGDVTWQSITLTSAGGAPVPGYEGALKWGGDLNENVAVQLIAQRTNDGARYRVYLDEADDDRPLIDQTVPQGYPPPETDFQDDPGATFFQFGPTTVSRSLGLTYFEFADYVEDRVELRPDTGLGDENPTMARMILRVRERIARGSSGNQSNIDDDRIRMFLNDEVEKIILTLGDSAWFMTREAAFSDEDPALTVGSDGLVTMPAFVERVHRVFTNDDYRREVTWREERQNPDGTITIWIAPGYRQNELRYTYLVRHQTMASDHDRCPIPRKHLEIVVVGAALRIAESDNRPEFRNTMLARHRELMGLMRSEQNRHLTQRREILEAVRYPSRAFHRRGRRSYYGYWD